MYSTTPAFGSGGAGVLSRDLPRLAAACHGRHVTGFRISTFGSVSPFHRPSPYLAVGIQQRSFRAPPVTSGPSHLSTRSLRATPFPHGPRGNRLISLPPEFRVRADQPAPASRQITSVRSGDLLTFVLPSFRRSPSNHESAACFACVRPAVEMRHPHRQSPCAPHPRSAERPLHHHVCAARRRTATLLTESLRR